MQYARVYDQQLHLLAVLDNADAGYSLKSNDLSTASVTLPTPDPKNQYMAAHNFVRIYDGDEEVGLFRIITEPGTSNAVGGWTEYTLEHVIATLVDDIMFGYHEVGGADYGTASVAEYILSQQVVQRWVLGRCDFTDEFSYKFENTDLLTALFSLGNVLTDEYLFEYDTTGYPWVVSLVRPDADPGCEIRYRRNMQEVIRTMDASALVTRLYLLGYGEGVNQLTIRDVNGGLPYLEAASAATWGVKSSVYVDGTIEDAQLLKARGEAMLSELCMPYMAYSASAIDLYRLTGQSWDNYKPGKLVHVRDDDKNIDFTARIITKTKPDIYGDPGGLELEIANRVRDLADSINRLAERQGIRELYSQGATNLYSQQFADNADATHPAVMRFYVPEGCVRINSMLLSWALQKFRAYSTAASNGGGQAVTSGGGGSGTVTADPVDESGTGLGRTSYVFSLGTSSVSSHSHQIDGPGATSTGSAGGHSHTVNDHYHTLSQIKLSNITVTLPSHTHTVTCPNHSHGITYGIYEGGQATAITLEVDGTEVPASAISGSELDVCPWLTKDSAGKITRGAWHEIRIIPDAMTRIEANLFAQCFVQSRGGGDY